MVIFAQMLMRDTAAESGNKTNVNCLVYNTDKQMLFYVFT